PKIRSITEKNILYIDNMEIKDYKTLIVKVSLENELLNMGYTLMNKVIINENGHNKTHFIKAKNRKGQNVYILIDVDGYTTVDDNDLILKEYKNISIIPHSIKSGALNNACNEVHGVAFECNSNAI